MKIICDSGSTKADWVLVDGQSVVGRVVTQGISPVHQDAEEISRIISEELLLATGAARIGEVAFYGSGVRPDLQDDMCRLLSMAFLSARRVEAWGDMLGAARALCGRNYGIASILGTGANSCLYDGESIVQNTPALGYILGDEGSGAVLGRLFLNAVFKGILPKGLRDEFFEKLGLSLSDIINKVYREPLANRFLASLCPFIRSHLYNLQLRQLVEDEFCHFFRSNIRPYGRPDLAVSFVGSIAYFFADVLRDAAAREGFRVGAIVRSPLDGLVKYHSCD